MRAWEGQMFGGNERQGGRPPYVLKDSSADPAKRMSGQLTAIPQAFHFIFYNKDSLSRFLQTLD